MGKHKLSRAGAYRGFRRPDPAKTSAGPCRQISPTTGEVTGIFAPVVVTVPKAKLWLQSWRPRIEVAPC